MKLIGISGKMGTGKSTVAQHLKLKGYEEYRFSSVIKDMVAVLLNVSPDWLEDEEFKKQTSFGVTNRFILQTLGTDWGRQMIDENIWVNATFNRIRSPKAIISDVRFPNEADAILSKGGVIIRIERDREVGDPKDRLHPSETALDNYNFPTVYRNNGTYAELFRFVDSVERSLKDSREV